MNKYRYAAEDRQSIGSALTLPYNNQKYLADIAKDITGELRLQPATITDVVHQTPRGAKPSMMLKLRHSGNLAKAAYAGAWMGLMTNQPGMLIFNRGEGKDLLHTIRTGVNGTNIDNVMKQFNIQDYLLKPQKYGYHVLVFDKEAQNGSNIQQLSRYLKGKLSSTRGIGVFIGGKDPRAFYRKVIREYENKDNEQPQQMKRRGYVRRYVSVPLDLGKTHIPRGHIRLFHYTRGIPQQLREQGILLSKAKGHTYAEPNIIWGSTLPPELHHNIVEYHVPTDDEALDRSLNHPSKSNESLEDWMRGNHHVGIYRNIKPEEIIAVHEPWHHRYRYIKDNPNVEQDIVNGEHDDLINNEEYGPAILQVKKEHA